MKRTILIAATIAVLLTVAVAAQPFRGDAPEETTLTGRITLAAGELPVLVSGGERYTLRISPALAEDLQVSNNAQATITGYLREMRAQDLLTTERLLMVQSIETGGTRYVTSMRGMARGRMQFGGAGQFGGPSRSNPRAR